MQWLISAIIVLARNLRESALGTIFQFVTIFLVTVQITRNARFREPGKRKMA